MLHTSLNIMSTTHKRSIETLINQGIKRIKKGNYKHCTSLMAVIRCTIDLQPDIKQSLEQIIGGVIEETEIPEFLREGLDTEAFHYEFQNESLYLRLYSK